MSLDYLHFRQKMKLGFEIKESKPEEEVSIKKETKARKQLVKVSATKKAKLKANKPKANALVQWFKDKIAALKGVCQECGAPINITDHRFAKMSVAHVLPKREGQFPSVATHIENFLELGVVCGCHSHYDKGWDEACTMKIWPEVVRKFKIMYPSIAKEERKHIPEILLQELDPQ